MNLQLKKKINKNKKTKAKKTLWRGRCGDCCGGDDGGGVGVVVDGDHHLCGPCLVVYGRVRRRGGFGDKLRLFSGL